MRELSRFSFLWWVCKSILSPCSQIIDGKLYRQKECHFPARCAGVEHYLKSLLPKLPNMELAINTRDWPQINRQWGHKAVPVFSFSKVNYFITFFSSLPLLRTMTGFGRLHFLWAPIKIAFKSLKSISTQSYFRKFVNFSIPCFLY